MKVTLQKVFSGQSKEARLPNQDIETSISWQEKILGPSDRLSSYRKRCLIDPKLNVEDIRHDLSNGKFSFYFVMVFFCLNI